MRYLILKVRCRNPKVSVVLPLVRPQRTHKGAQASKRCPGEEPGRQQERDYGKGDEGGCHTDRGVRPIMPSSRDPGAGARQHRLPRSSQAEPGLPRWSRVRHPGEGARRWTWPRAASSSPCGRPRRSHGRSSPTAHGTRASTTATPAGGGHLRRHDRLSMAANAPSRGFRGSRGECAAWKVRR